MKYRVEFDISFETEAECLDFIKGIKEHKSKPVDALEPAPGPTLTMPKYLRWSMCRHDEVPPAPCGPYVYVDSESKTQLAARLKAEAAALAAIPAPEEPVI